MVLFAYLENLVSFPKDLIWSRFSPSHKTNTSLTSIVHFHIPFQCVSYNKYFLDSNFVCWWLIIFQFCTLGIIIKSLLWDLHCHKKCTQISLDKSDHQSFMTCILKNYIVKISEQWKEFPSSSNIAFQMSNEIGLIWILLTDV